MKYAWVTITGKVYVDDAEIEDLKDGADLDEDRVFDEEEAFKSLAKDKIYELFPTDDPFKLEDVSIDMSTYK